MQATKSTFQGLEVCDQVCNLTFVQLKLWHIPVRGHDSLGKRLREILNRIAAVERAEWRCNPQRTFSNVANCMT